MITRHSIRERGFALLIVLWTLVLVTLVLSRVLAAGRTEVQLAGNLRASALAEAIADGAVYEATYRVMANQWRADGRIRPVRVGTGVAEVRIENLVDRLNPNMTPLAVMRRLLVELGAAPQQAAALAAAMEDWRTPGDDPLPLGAKAPQYRAAGLAYVPTGQPFRSLDEVGLVRGMTPDLLAALAPHVSVFEEGDPDPTLADPLVAQALASGNATVPPAVPDDMQPVLVVEITATAMDHGRPRFTRRAVVRFAAVARSNPSPWRILSWDTPGG